MTVDDKVRTGSISTCCFDCASIHRKQQAYDGTYTVRDGICQICNKPTKVASALKLFGYHKFIG